ncbi:hypothetical protein M5689_020629 [Euphorbia peplus]|nr:hypothetical protein M5689_020629 [Euphorbia peplus]
MGANKGGTPSTVMVPNVDEQLVRRLSTFTVDEHTEAYQLYKGMRFWPIRSLCQESVKKLKLQAGVKAYLERGGFDRILNIKEPAYRELTLEFLATFQAIE